MKRFRFLSKLSEMDGDKFILLYVVFTFGQIVFNLILSEQIGDEDCYRLNTCDYAKNIYVPNCYCDHLCHIYDDCCIDYIIKDEQNLKPEEIKELTERAREECLPLYWKYLGVNVIQNCPKNNHSVNQKIVPQNGSENIFDILPVTSLNNVVYRNIYIAKCNEDTNYKFWQLIFELSLCLSTKEIDIVNASELDVANNLLQIGCHYTLVPPSETPPPRFCMKFELSDGHENSSRLPVRANTGVFRNEGSCRGYLDVDGCSGCFESGLRTPFQITSRHGLSMNALFKISNEMKQERYASKETAANVAVLFRNLKLSRELRASTLDEFNIKEWDRASFFYTECVMHALKDFEPYFGSFSRLYFSKELGSDEGHVIGNVDIFIGKELQSHTVLADIETWLDKHRIKYTETSESGTITYEFKTQRLTKKTAFAVCSDDTFVCQFLGEIRKELVESDIIRQIKQSKKFPGHKCLEIHGTVEIFKNRKSFNVVCLTPTILVQMPKIPGTMSLMSVLRFAFLCLSSICTCAMLHCYKKGYLRKTIFGHVYVVLFFASFFNQILKTFVLFYTGDGTCNVMKLISRMFIFAIQTLTILGSLSFIYFMIKIKSTTNKSFLEDRVKSGLLIVLSIAFPLALTYMINQFSKPILGGLSCEVKFIIYDSFTYASCIAEIIIIVLVITGSVIYIRKGYEINLIKGSLIYVVAYKIVAILSLVCLIVSYFERNIDFHIITWVDLCTDSLQVPLLTVSVFFQKYL